MSESGHLTAEDYEEIRNTLCSWAFIIDAKEWDRAGEVYAKDISFNSPRINVDNLEDLVVKLKEGEPAHAHHVTNMVITPAGAEKATVRYKTLTFRLDDTPRYGEVTDTFVKTSEGWRVGRRELYRRTPR